MGNISRDSLDEELAKAAGVDDATETRAAGPTRSSSDVGNPRSWPDDGAPAHSADPRDLEGAMAVPDPPEPRPDAPLDARRPPGRSSWGLLATLLVMVGCIVSLFMFGFKDAAVYSVPIDKLLAEATVGRRVRIDGELVPGTLTKRNKPCEFRFKIRGGGKVLDVHFPQCVVPDTFRDVPEGGVMVTAEGKLTRDGFFDASLLLAKCSSKYDAKTHKMSPDAVNSM